MSLHVPVNRLLARLFSRSWVILHTLKGNHTTMTDTQPRQSNALDILKSTSRTFYIPIALLPQPLQNAVASAYLCMRAIDEVEDHPGLENGTKADLLERISNALQSLGGAVITQDAHFQFLQPYLDALPEVTLRLRDWIDLAPAAIAPRVLEATAAMADRMTAWARRNWLIRTVEDLDHYTFSVAGSVGLLLSDIWAWYDGTASDRQQAVGFGRALQSVNIIRNRAEDHQRGVDFFPAGWTAKEMNNYALGNLSLAVAYTNNLPAGSPAQTFCKIPLGLAYATLTALTHGLEKLSRDMVTRLVTQLTQPNAPLPDFQGLYHDIAST